MSLKNKAKKWTTPLIWPWNLFCRKNGLPGGTSTNSWGKAGRKSHGRYFGSQRWFVFPDDSSDHHLLWVLLVSCSAPAESVPTDSGCERRSRSPDKKRNTTNVLRKIRTRFFRADTRLISDPVLLTILTIQTRIAHTLNIFFQLCRLALRFWNVAAFGAKMQPTFCWRTCWIHVRHLCFHCIQVFLLLDSMQCFNSPAYLARTLDTLRCGCFSSHRMLRVLALWIRTRLRRRRQSFRWDNLLGIKKPACRRLHFILLSICVCCNSSHNCVWCHGREMRVLRLHRLQLHNNR